MSTSVRKFATNNMMALPRNPSPVKTLKAAPGASMVFVQEANLGGFKAILDELGPHRISVPGFVGKGQAYSCTILFDPRVWRYVPGSVDYPLAYKGKHGISYDRHLCVAIFELIELGKILTGISAHSVTAGGDKQRRRMRGEGDGAIHRARDAALGRGNAVVLGIDQNGTGNRLGPANVHTQHRLDHVYGWDGPHLTLGKRARRVIDTRSDHDVLVAGLAMATR